MKTKDLAYIALFAAITAVLGLVPAIQVGPVPITAQTLGVMLAGAILGARRGFLSQLLFLVLVAIGLPLLASGAGGLAVFAGPTARLPDQLADRGLRRRAAHRAVLGALQPGLGHPRQRRRRHPRHLRDRRPLCWPWSRTSRPRPRSCPGRCRSSSATGSRRSSPRRSPSRCAAATR